jgi:hypothetical protein
MALITPAASANEPLPGLALLYSARLIVGVIYE